MAEPSLGPVTFSTTPAAVTSLLLMVTIGASGVVILSLFSPKILDKVFWPQRFKDASMASLTLEVMVNPSMLDVLALKEFKKATRLMVSVLFKSAQLTLPLGSAEPSGASLAKMASVTFKPLAKLVGATLKAEAPATRSASNMVLI